LLRWPTSSKAAPPVQSMFFKMAAAAPRKKVVDVGEIPTWDTVCAERKSKNVFVPAPASLRKNYACAVDADLNGKISLWRGDITSLKIDAIVNAANSGLWAGGGICGAIHSAAGRELEAECERIGSCPTGSTAITKGYRLPAKYVMHSVGPTNGSAKALTSCYRTCLDLAVKSDVRSLAFCCIATGIFGFDNNLAAVIALDTTRKWLSEGDNRSRVDRIVFCTFLDIDTKIYDNFTSVFFPVHADDVALSAEEKQKLDEQEKADAAERAADSDSTSEGEGGRGTKRRASREKGPDDGTGSDDDDNAKEKENGKAGDKDAADGKAEPASPNAVGAAESKTRAPDSPDAARADSANASAAQSEGAGLGSPLSPVNVGSPTAALAAAPPSDSAAAAAANTGGSSALPRES